MLERALTAHQTSSRMAEKPNPPSKHHYLPEFYTRRWSSGEPAEMLRYSRVWGGKLLRRRATPGGIGFDRDLYTMPNAVDADDAQQIENHLFRLVDGHGGRLLEQMLAGDVPTSAEERSKWAAFVLSLLHRHPKDVSSAVESFSALVETTDPEIAALPEIGRELAIRQLWRSVNNPRLGSVLINMKWDVLDLRDGGISLLTSDTPLITSNGIRPPDGNYALPLPPTHLFVAAWRGPARTASLAKGPKWLAKLANKLIVQRAREFVIASDERNFKLIEARLGEQPVSYPAERLAQIYREHPGATREELQAIVEADYPDQGREPFWWVPTPDHSKSTPPLE